MIGQLMKIAGQCDGVRCDMAMLVLPEVFERTWGIRAQPFWPKAIEPRSRRSIPDFRFMAEVYWDLEWTLQQQGFDYTYDKRLYDRLRDGHVRPVREHFSPGMDYQNKLIRFLENHDEPRAAADLLAGGASRPRPSSPSCRPACDSSIRDNSRDARNASRRISAVRRMSRSTLHSGSSTTGCWPCCDQPVVARRPLAVARVPPGLGRQLDQRIALSPSPGKTTPANGLLLAVNYAANQSQCYVRLPFADLGGRQWRLARSA